MDVAIQTDERARLAHRTRLRWILMGGGSLVLMIAALAVYLTSGRIMSTDDAEIQAAQTPISANVAGRVVRVAVTENQHVHKGDLLFQLDPRPFQIQLADAQARLATARLQVLAAKANYRHQAADRQAARDTLSFQRRELERQQHLVQIGITSRAQFDQAQHAADLAQQQANAADQQLDSARAALGGDVNMAIDAHPSVMQAQAALDRAKLDLSYAAIYAPQDGIVTKVVQLQPGAYVTPAVEVFTLVSTRDLWVEANFKEDQLTHMRPGQSASVWLDAYPGHKFRAVVASLSPGTGAQFSVLPAENATGNWVKVVQRVPVRLQLLDRDSEQLLQSGLSATVDVDTGYRRWASLR